MHDAVLRKFFDIKDAAAINIHCSTVPSWTSIPHICNLVDVGGPFLSPSAASRRPPVRLKILAVETRYKRTCLWETERYICLVHNTHLFHRCSAAAKLRRVYKYRFLTVGQRAGGYCYGDGMAPRRLPDWVHIIRYVVLDARQSLPSILRVVFCGGGRKSLGKGSTGTSS